MKEMSLIRTSPSGPPTPIYVYVRPSRRSNALYWCHLLCEDPQGGELPLQVGEVALNLN
jgi:hypothetical protein